MPLWRAVLLNLYYHATLPLRWWQVRRARAAGRVPLAVLCYHRTADDDATPWTISNRVFARQIGWLGRHFELISLAETQRRIRSGVNPRPALSITFDDGYAENCLQALPLLLGRKIPCTYFVTAGNVLQGAPFEHDLGCGHRFPANTPQQLRELAAAGVEIGAHSYSHADFGGITDPRQFQRELVGARDDLEASIGAPIRYFAFPFGQRANLSRRAFEAAAAAGYDAVCSAYGGLNLPGQDAFHLRRIAVDASTMRLKNRVTGDPRKRNLPPLAWESPAGWRTSHVAT
jgi:peptidoglycan/xylan/chitin deacetylase (PgdA/CDA1 family)